MNIYKPRQHACKTRLQPHLVFRSRGSSLTWFQGSFSEPQLRLQTMDCAKKFIHLLYEFVGIFMVVFSCTQMYVSDRQAKMMEDRANGCVLAEGEGCGWTRGQMLFFVINYALASGLIGVWFVAIFISITRPYGTLGYVIQVSELKRKTWFRRVVLWNICVMCFICVGILGLGSSPAFIMSVFLVLGSLMPYYITVGTAVPLLEKCHHIPIRKMSINVFKKTDNIINLLEDGIIEMAAANAAGVPLTQAGNLLKKQLEFTAEECDILQSSLIAEEIGKEEQRSLFHGAVKSVLGKALDEVKDAV